jgi:hypothetical protein
LHFGARDAELNQLKMLVEQLADKVNARGVMPAERLAAAENRVDEVATHGIRMGTTLGLAAMAMHTGVDYSIQPRHFLGGAPEDIDEIEVILERLDGHVRTMCGSRTGGWSLLTDKTRIHLRSSSVRTYTFFTTGFPRFLSIRGARGLLALNQVLI